MKERKKYWKGKVGKITHSSQITPKWSWCLHKLCEAEIFFLFSLFFSFIFLALRCYSIFHLLNPHPRNILGSKSFYTSKDLATRLILLNSLNAFLPLRFSQSKKVPLTFRFSFEKLDFSFIFSSNYLFMKTFTIHYESRKKFCIYLYAGILLHHHHAQTLSRHFSLSFIASGISSVLHPVSSHSCWMYFRTGRSAFARSYVGVHRSTSLMSSSLLLQQWPACLVRLTWIVFVMEGRWLYSWCLVGCCRQDLFNIVRNILV